MTSRLPTANGSPGASESTLVRGQGDTFPARGGVKGRPFLGSEEMNGVTCDAQAREPSGDRDYLKSSHAVSFPYFASGF